MNTQIVNLVVTNATSVLCLKAHAGSIDRLISHKDAQVLCRILWQGI